MSDDGSGSACRYNSHFWSCRSFFAHLRNLARTTLEARAIEVANEMVGLSAVAIAETKRASMKAARCICKAVWRSRAVLSS